MFESSVIDTARSRRADPAKGRRRSAIFVTALLALASLSLTGCATYYGYDDIHDEITTPMPDGAPRDVRHYAVVTAEKGNASLKCFKRYILPKNAMKESRIVGRKERYRDYEAWWYFENPPYNAGWNKDAWLFSVDGGYIGVAIANSGKDPNPVATYIAMAIAPTGVGQAMLCIDAVHFLGVLLIDSCFFIGKCCWTGVSIPCGWLGGRLFGCWGDWHLAEHGPGPLRMTSYMPFINLFMFQSPPYMTDGPNRSEIVRYDDDDHTVVKRTQVVILTPKQELYAQCKVEARVLRSGEPCGSREFRTDGEGEVKLTEFLRGCVQSAPLTARDFTLELKLSDAGGKVILMRNVEFKADQLMSVQAARDLAAYRRSDTDYLNKLLLRRRSHREWRQEVFADEVSIPAAK